MPYGMYPFAGMMGGVSPTNQAIAGVKVNSWLTPETINSLRKDGAQFTLALSEEDIARAQCNHRNQDGTPSLNTNDDGSCKCSICGYTFNITDEYSIEQVEAACKCVTDILQTIKVMYISMNPEIGRQFFQIIAFMDKIPKLYKIAAQDYKKYENVYGMTPGMPQSAFNVFAALSNPMVGFGVPQYAGYGTVPGMDPATAAMYGQQTMGQPAQPPMGYGVGMQPAFGTYPGAVVGPNGQPVAPQPGMQAAPMGYGAPQQQPNAYAAVGGNPFYANQPAGYAMPGQQPQGFAMNPQGAAAPAAQPAQAAPKPNDTGAPAVTADHKA